MEPQIKVSVLMLAFNHEKYCIQAIESVLNQKVNFAYEILITDDASTDKTAKIIDKAYCKNEKVKLFRRKKNVGGTRNAYFLRKKAKGKYLIVLECDDYWKDNTMLQKRVDFLEVHGEYIGVGGKLEVVNERGRYMRDILPKEYYNCQYTIEDFLNAKPIHFRAFLWKNCVKEIGDELKLLYQSNPNLGDFTSCLLFLEKGKVYIDNNVTACYRFVEKRGSSNYNSLKSWFEKYEDHIKVIKVLEKKHNIKHDYTTIYLARTAKVMSQIAEDGKYHYFFRVLKLIGVKKTFMTILHYNEYKNVYI